MASNNDAKPLSLYDIHFSLIFITRRDTYLGLKQASLLRCEELNFNFALQQRYPRVYPLGKFEKLYLCKIIACDIFSISLPDNHLHTNRQLINLLYYDVKNLNF